MLWNPVGQKLLLMFQIYAKYWIYMTNNSLICQLQRIDKDIQTGFLWPNMFKISFFGGFQNTVSSLTSASAAK